MTTPRCLVCGRSLNSISPDSDWDWRDAALLCGAHTTAELTAVGVIDPEGLDERIDFIENIRVRLKGNSINQIWYRSDYFSLLLELSDYSFLVVFPLDRLVRLLYVPRGVALSAPSDLHPLPDVPRSDVRGPRDPGRGAKSGLWGLQCARRRGLKFTDLRHSIDGRGNPSDEGVAFYFDGGFVLDVVSVGWDFYSEVSIADDLDLLWRDERDPSSVSTGESTDS